MKTTEEKLKFFMENHGKECEFSNDGENWTTDTLTGYDSSDKHIWRTDKIWYHYVRPLKQPKIKRIPWTPETAPFPLALRKKIWPKWYYVIFEIRAHRVRSCNQKYSGLSTWEMNFEDLASEDSEWETREGNPCCDFEEVVE